ncbi:Transcription factor MYB63 isoform D [Glycine soja]|uniref:Transcription factor MYB63 isoform C n=1 Tax=Glycine soja TaxID=3848 RepID=A0A445F0R5_GLYSO|nr:Transcription factor MYB63 isoform C [Glycine soja]RZB42409.1 Transcription factor MYB63 isoform D [Glycine soja]
MLQTGRSTSAIVIILPGDKILGLAKISWVLESQEMPRTSSIKISIPLILSLPERVYSLTKKGHLKKLRFSFQLTTPHGHVFKPNQAFFKLRHLKHVQFTCSDLVEDENDIQNVPASLKCQLCDRQ